MKNSNSEVKYLSLRSVRISKFSGPLAGTLIVLAGLAAYHHSFSGPFVFDDRASIPDNPTIRSLWPLGPVFSPPPRAGLGGRPIFNLSLALNYAIGGTKVRGYHAVNLLIHLLAGLTLFGIVRRTLDSKRGTGFQPVLGNDHGLPAHATFLAFAIALLWTLHPLQTEAVTWVSGRAESLMGLFYLLTLYGFIRYADESEREKRKAEIENAEPCRRSKFPHSAFRFPLFSISACFLGMATKEVMVTAPVMVLLYDRTFVSGGFREAWRRHRWLYLGLASSWLLLLRVVANARAQGVGVGVGGTWWAYALTECRVIVQYLGLAFWPHPLVFDYGSGVPSPTWALLPYVAIVLGLAAVTAWALFCPAAPDSGGQPPFGKFRTSKFVPSEATGISMRNLRALGFAGAWIVLILAPTSSVVAVAGQPMAEHRMYLPLVAVIAVVVLGGDALLLGRGPQRRRGVPPRSDDDTRRNAASTFMPFFAVAAVAIVLGCLTAQRNQAYRSDVALWSDTVARRPANARAQNGLGLALFNAGQTAAAIARYREAVRLEPDYPEAHQNLGAALKASGRIPEAVSECEAALRLRPESPSCHYNLGVALQADGRSAEAAGQFAQTLQLQPDYPDAQYNLGAALAAEGDLPGAIGHFEAAVRLDPDDPDMHYDLANALAQVGRGAEAIAQFEEVLRLNPADAPARNNLGIALAGAGRFPEAVAQLRMALQLAPGRADYHFNLAALLLREDRVAEARDEFGRALELRPDYEAAREQLAQLQDLRP